MNPNTPLRELRTACLSLHAFLALYVYPPPQGLLSCRPRPAPGSAPRPSQLLAMTDRSILKLLKTLGQIQEVHPWWVRTPPIPRA